MFVEIDVEGVEFGLELLGLRVGKEIIGYLMVVGGGSREKGLVAVGRVGGGVRVVGRWG